MVVNVMFYMQLPGVEHCASQAYSTSVAAALFEASSASTPASDNSTSAAAFR